MNIQIRPAKPGDAEAILRLIEALADFEKLPPARRRCPRAVDCRCFRTSILVSRFSFADVDARVVGYAFVFETYFNFPCPSLPVS